MVCEKIKVKFVALLLIVAVFCTSCFAKKEDDQKLFDGDRNVFTYSSKCVDFHSDDEYLAIKNVIPYNGYYYAVVESFSTDLSWHKVFLYCLDLDGNKLSEIELNSDINIYVCSDIYNGEFTYVTHSGKLERADINTGEITYSSQCTGTLCGVNSCEDGYVVFSIGRIDKYDSNNELVASIENSDWDMFNGSKNFYSDNEKCYLVSYSSFSWKYYELDFENSTSTLLFDPSQNEERVLDCCAQYIFDESGEYLMDFENSCMHPLAKWSDMNLQPPQYSNTEPIYIGIDTESFLQIYNYEGGIAQLVIYSYEETINYSDRTYITVGGFNCSYDLALNWAIYKYNTSQSEYRIVVEDYSKEFGWDMLEDAMDQKAALIQYFNSGNAPDIFYGNNFDYDSFASNGTTMDISQYMMSDYSECFENMTPSIRDLMVNEDGSCYRVFSCYQLEGYCTSFDTDEDLSIEEATSLADSNGVTMVCNEKSYDLATRAIQFSLLSDGSCSEEDIRDILDFSYEYGVPSSSTLPGEVMSRSTINDYLLWHISVFSVLYMNDVIKDCGSDLTFVGFPSVRNSHHVVVPYGQVAVSSSTSYPEECCKFISYLLDEDIQDLSNLSCFIPVNDACMRKMVDYSEDHSIIPDDDFAYRMYLSSYSEVSSEASQVFYQFISAADTVSYYDWGIMGITYEEVESYYTQDKPVALIVESLFSRLNVYLSEY